MVTSLAIAQQLDSMVQHAKLVCIFAKYRSNSCIYILRNVLSIQYHLNILVQLHNFTSLDPCDPNPCKNGGICSRDGHGSYICDCTSTSFIGQTCSSSKNYFLIALYKIFCSAASCIFNLYSTYLHYRELCIIFMVKLDLDKSRSILWKWH